MNLTALIARLTELDARVEVDPFNRKLTEEWQQELVDNVPTLLEALAIQREALDKLAKGNRAPGVLAIARDANARVDALASKEGA